MHCYFFSLCLLPTFIHLLCASKPSVAVAYTPLAVNISLENDVLSLADQLDALKNAVPYISRHLMKQSPPTRSRLLKPQVRRSSTGTFCALGPKTLKKEIYCVTRGRTLQ